MRQRDDVSKLFIVTAAIILVVVLLMRDYYCNGHPPISEKSIKDAVIKALDSAQKRWQHKEDSLSYLATRIQREADSLQWLKIQADSHLQVSANRASQLAAEVQRLRSQGRDSAALENCDTLALVVVDLERRLAEQWQVTDSLLQTKDRQIAIADERLEGALAINQKMRQAVDSVSMLYNDLDKRYMKVARKADKKYTLSLSVGYGAGIQGGLQPIVGITISRTLIRF